MGLVSMVPIEAFALYKLNLLSGEEIYSFANDKLNEGVYTDSLNDIFAESDHSLYVLGPIFESAMEQLSVPQLSKYEASILLIRCNAEKVLKHVKSPKESAEFLYYKVHRNMVSEVPDKSYLGDNLGLDNVFAWLRELWDCMDGSMLLRFNDLPRDSAKDKIMSELTNSFRDWLQSPITNRHFATTSWLQDAATRRL